MYSFLSQSPASNVGSVLLLLASTWCGIQPITATNSNQQHLFQHHQASDTYTHKQHTTASPSSRYQHDQAAITCILRCSRLDYATTPYSTNKSFARIVFTTSTPHQCPSAEMHSVYSNATAKWANFTMFFFFSKIICYILLYVNDLLANIWTK